MTLNQWFLLGVLVVGAASAGAAWWTLRKQSRWRRLDSLKEFIVSWRAQVKVLDINEVPYWIGYRREKDFRLAIEDDGWFGEAFAMFSKELRRQYEEFRAATSNYIEACSQLYADIAQDCQTEARLPLGEWPIKTGLKMY